MTIVEALKNKESDVRITYGNRELLWHHGQWRVYDYEAERVDPMLIATDDEAKAVAALLTGENV